MRGVRQQADIDYDPTNKYASVASHGSIRILMAIADAQNLIPEGANLNKARMDGELDIIIFIEEPTDSTKRYAMPGQGCNNKSLYIIKQTH